MLNVLITPSANHHRENIRTTLRVMNVKYTENEEGQILATVPASELDTLRIRAAQHTIAVVPDFVTEHEPVVVATPIPDGVYTIDGGRIAPLDIADLFDRLEAYARHRQQQMMPAESQDANPGQSTTPIPDAKKEEPKK